MIREEHREEKWAFPFVKYTPDNVKKGEKLPLVVQLHGAGERGEGKEDLNKVDILGFSKHISEKDYRCIYVMPQCPTNSFWAARVESIISFIKDIVKEYNIDEDRIYLVGISMGGFGTWYTAMAAPELFAAIAPVCGGGMAWNAGVLTMPIMTYHGAEDKVVDPFNTDDMVVKLRALGRDVTYVRVDGVGHNVWTHTFDSKLMEWLLSHKKN